ncbi:hypothetical protein ACF0H5_021900 [Mactra antiquata]
MQDELDSTTTNPDKVSKTVYSNIPKKYSVSPQKSIRSYSTRDSEQTGGSKRDTEEEELRSLSTTPRYSHEDLGRIVSPPHSSDYYEQSEVNPTDTAADGDNEEEDISGEGDTLSTQQVYLKSRTSHYTHAKNLAYSDKESIYSDKTRSVIYSDQIWSKPSHIDNKKDILYSDTDITPRYNQSQNRSFAVGESTTSSLSTTARAPKLTSIKAKREFLIKKARSKKPAVKSTASRRSDHSRLRSTEGYDYNRLRAAELLEMRMTGVDNSLRNIMRDAEAVQRDLSIEQDRRLILEKRLKEVEDEKKDLNAKLASLRVKFGVASSNFNVSKNESEQMRKKYQETQIHQARLEERIKTCTRDLERLKDPNNPDSNVNLKKIVANDRKEIRRLKAELEGIRSERSEVQKQIQDKDEKIKMLNINIGEAKEQLEECNRDYEVAQISVVGERKKKEEVEVKYNELMKEKNEFDTKMADIQTLLDVAMTGSTGIQKLSDEYREREKSLEEKIQQAEKKLRDALTEVEKQKNRNMPFRTSTSIKHHQYRMSNSVMVTDTTPHVIIATNTNASIGGSGLLGKTVISTKPVSSLPGGSKTGSKVTPRSKGGSLPAKK